MDRILVIEFLLDLPLNFLQIVNSINHSVTTFEWTNPHPP